MLDKKKWDVSVKVTPLVLKMESDRFSPASAFGSIQKGESNDWWSVHCLGGGIPLDNHGGMFDEVEDCCFGARLWKDWTIFCPAVVLVIGLKWIFFQRELVSVGSRNLVLREILVEHLWPINILCVIYILSPATSSASWSDSPILNPPVIASSSWPWVKVRM